MSVSQTTELPWIQLGFSSSGVSVTVTERKKKKNRPGDITESHGTDEASSKHWFTTSFLLESNARSVGMRVWRCGVARVQHWHIWHTIFRLHLAPAFFTPALESLIQACLAGTHLCRVKGERSATRLRPVLQASVWECSPLTHTAEPAKKSWVTGNVIVLLSFL